jgi:chromate reductase
MKLLAISGSLRAASHNTAALIAAKRLAREGVVIDLFDGIGELPFFNSDLDTPEHLPRSFPASRCH